MKMFFIHWGRGKRNRHHGDRGSQNHPEHGHRLVFTDINGIGTEIVRLVGLGEKIDPSYSGRDDTTVGPLDRQTLPIQTSDHQWK